MSIFTIFVIVILVVAVVWAVNSYLPLPEPIKMVFNILVVLLAIYVILTLIGVAPALHR